MTSSRFSLWIAWRYLFAKKSHNAINILTAISAAAIAVGTAALICVLSVMNGFEHLVEQMFSAFDPQLRIEAAEGKSFHITDTLDRQLKNIDEISIISPTIEETALLKYADRQEPVYIKGVADDFRELTDIESLIVDGSYRTRHNETEWIVTGAGLELKLGIQQQIGAPLTIYCPRRKGNVNTLRPDQSFNQAGVLLAGSFAVQQISYDDKYALISLGLARDIFEYDSTQVTALELKLKSTANEKRTQQKIRDLIGEKYTVINRYEQQADFYRIMNIEKWLTFLLMAFILLIATFNIIGSLSMLRIEKQADTSTLRSLGATDDTLRRIFLYEGWLITALGTAAGIIIGITVCVLQQQLGLITFGNAEQFLSQPYPVVIRFTDILATAALVGALGLLAAYYPARQTTKDTSEHA